MLAVTYIEEFCLYFQSKICFIIENLSHKTSQKSRELVVTTTYMMLKKIIGLHASGPFCLLHGLVCVQDEGFIVVKIWLWLHGCHSTGSGWTGLEGIKNCMWCVFAAFKDF